MSNFGLLGNLAGGADLLAITLKVWYSEPFEILVIVICVPGGKASVWE
jgi:hypothetical protein